MSAPLFLASPSNAGQQLRFYATAPSLNVVVCGSFRRDPEMLKRAYSILQQGGCTVLSPASVDFVAEDRGFVMTSAETDRPPTAIEREHVAAIQTADLVWLHAPGGYVGPSGAFELGVAHLAGVPIFTREPLADIALSEFVRVVGSPLEAVVAIQDSRLHKAGAPLRALQRYYKRMAELRGWTDETPKDCLLLLSEEIGELQSAARKAGYSVATTSRSQGEVALELADVQLYLVHLANVMGIDLAAAVSLKEDINAARFPLVEEQESAAA